MDFIPIAQDREPIFLSKTLLVMKISLLLLVCCITSAFSMESLAQPTSANMNMSISMKNVTVENILNRIEEISSYHFLYNKQQVNVVRKINVDVKNQSIQQVLNLLFEGSDVEYSINNRQIVLSKVSSKQQTPANSGHLLTGVVVDENGEAIIGANVTIKGEKIGVVTDADGRFTLTVPDNGILVISYIGYLTQETKYGNKKSITIVMKENNKALDEVVVVGFGQQKKESVIGAIQGMKPADMRLPTSNLTTTFAGRIAGVISVQKTGEPGADGANFWIRGVGTFASAQNPLILIDGTEASNYDLNALAPEVIESFSVLKDATATAVYGSRGANGVLLITTKSGQTDRKPSINIRLGAAAEQQ